MVTKIYKKPSLVSHASSVSLVTAGIVRGLTTH